MYGAEPRGAAVRRSVRSGGAGRVLLCGINPSLWSGLVGYHSPGPATAVAVLHEAGFTHAALAPESDDSPRPASESPTWSPERRPEPDELRRLRSVGRPACMALVPTAWQPRTGRVRSASRTGIATGERRAGRADGRSVGPRPRV